ncbi:MAG: hypothetical protein HFH45_03550 [Bacilli bacterium]|nr:hypothetical protein [Bacilli bacterium]
MKKKNKFDKINNLQTISRTRNLQTIGANREKIVGVKFDTNSKGSQNKIYYYRTTKNLKVGDKINPTVVTGGKPDSVVVSVDSIDKRKYNSLKELEL